MNFQGFRAYRQGANYGRTQERMETLQGWEDYRNKSRWVFIYLQAFLIRLYKNTDHIL